MPLAVNADTMIGRARQVVSELLPLQEHVNDIAQHATSLAMRSFEEGEPSSEALEDSRELHELINNRVASSEPVISPALLSRRLRLRRSSVHTTKGSREAAADIVFHHDNRLLVITGPCSVHNPEEALEYAERVAGWRERFGGQLEIFMRMYTEKPRTVNGWKGLTYDPELDDNSNINLGLVLTRMLAMAITERGVPIAMERLHGLTPQYLNGLVAYDAIGARNVTDQTAREYGSATSSVIGIKNGIDGDVQVGIDAVRAINNRHIYLGMDPVGTPSRIHSQGNDTAHLILRGGRNGPNYRPKSITRVAKLLAEGGVIQSVIVDASHGNSGKNHHNQAKVVRSIANQVAAGSAAIRGVMLESYLLEGNQNIDEVPHRPGVSITDACIGASLTETLLSVLARANAKRVVKEA